MLQAPFLHSLCAKNKKYKKEEALFDLMVKPVRIRALRTSVNRNNANFTIYLFIL